MENNKKSVGKTVLIVALLIVTIAALVLATYAWAKYTSTTDGTATAQVAKWNVNATTGNLTFSKTFTHVIDPNKLAPGTNGSIEAGLDVTGTEVDVKYTVTLVSVENKPTNLKFYSDADHKTEVSATNGTVATGTIATTDTTKTATKYLYWDWAYESGDDETDTTEGQAAKTMTVTYKIDAVQVKPE